MARKKKQPASSDLSGSAKDPNYPLNTFTDSAGYQMGVSVPDAPSNKEQSETPDGPLSTDKLKKMFEQPIKDVKIGRFITYLRNIIAESRMRNLTTWRQWAAIDESCNTPLKQLTPTLLNFIFAQNWWTPGLTGDQVNDRLSAELKEWGIPEDLVFTQISDPACKGGTRKVISRDLFVKVMIPLVLSVVESRAASIMAERSRVPFMEYQPVDETNDMEVICEVATKLVEQINVNFGYTQMFCQILRQALKYGFCLQFPVERWRRQYDVDLKGDENLRGEGIRYCLPHPSRCDWDRTYRPSTINTSTGCQWTMNWDVYKYGDIQSNPLFWNKDKLTWGTNWFDPAVVPATQYWQNFYPCIAQPFVARDQWDTYRNDRVATSTLYATGAYDSAVFLTNVFMYIVPSQWGLAEIDYPVHMQFVVANNDVVVWAEQYNYRPPVFYGADYDEGQAQPPSFAMKIVPFQDLVGNLMTSMLATAKNNVFRMVLFDRDQITQTQMQETLVKGASTAGTITLIGYSGNAKQGREQDPNNTFLTKQFAYADITPLVTCLNLAIDLMGRVSGLTDQEMGSAAKHIQSSKEMSVITSFSSNRMNWQAMGIDAGKHTWKQQLFEAMRSNMDGDFAVTVSRVPDEVAKQMAKDFGFEFKNNDKKQRTTVSGQMSKIPYAAFVSDREDTTRQSNAQLVQAILQAVSPVMSNPEMLQAFGLEWVAACFDKAWRLSGLPESEAPKIIPTDQRNPGMTQMVAQMAQQLKSIQQQMQQGEKSLQGGIMQLAQTNTQVNQQQDQKLQQQQGEISQLAQSLQQIQQSILELVRRTSLATGAPGVQPEQQPTPQPPPLA